MKCLELMKSMSLDPERDSIKDINFSGHLWEKLKKTDAPVFTFVLAVKSVVSLICSPIS